MTDLLSESFYYEIAQFIANVISNYRNSVCYFTTNAIMSMTDYFQALSLIFCLQKKNARPKINYLSTYGEFHFLLNVMN